MRKRGEGTEAARQKAEWTWLREKRRPDVRAYLQAQLEIERAKDEARRRLKKAKAALATFGASLDALACAWMAPVLRMAEQPRDGRGDAMWRAIVESQPMIGGPNGIDGPYQVPPADLRWIGQMSTLKTGWQTAREQPPEPLYPIGRKDLARLRDRVRDVGAAAVAAATKMGTATLDLELADDKAQHPNIDAIERIRQALVRLEPKPPIEPTDQDLAAVLYGDESDRACNLIRQRRKKYLEWSEDREADRRQAAEGSTRAEKRMSGAPPRRSRVTPKPRRKPRPGREG